MSSMSTEDIPSLLAQYRDFLALPLKDKNFDTLRHLLTRILAAGRNTSSSESYNPLAYVDPRHDLSWVSQTKTNSMPPRKGKAKAKGQQNPSRDLNTTAVDTTAAPHPLQVSAQHEHYQGYPNEHPPSSQHTIANQPVGMVPFHNNAAHRPILPPIGSFYEGQAALAPQYSTMSPTQAYGSTAPSNYQMPAVLNPGREAPSPRSIPPAPLVSYIRTSSIASSAGYSQPGQPQLSGSVTSRGSSDNHVLTPPNSNTGQPAPWQSQPTDGAPCNVEPPQGHLLAMGPPRLPPPTSQPLQQAATVADQTPATSASAPSTVQNSGPNPNPNTPPVNPTTIVKANRTGGPAYVTEAERAREHKNWRLHEDGFLLQYFVNPADPRAPQRLQQALAPQAYSGPKPYNRRVFLDLAGDPRYFNHTRPVQLIYEHFLKMRETLADILRFKEHYSIEWAGETDEEALLQRIQGEIIELRVKHGVRISLTAWRLHQYIMQSWYHWLRTSVLNDQPAVQTTTRFYSSNISPPASVASAPSALPSQTPVNVPLPSTAQNQAPALSRPPAKAAMPPPAPLAPQQSTDLPRDNQGALPSHEATMGTSTPPRTPSVSSLRISRDASSGRLARRNISSSVYNRSSGGPGSTGQTPTHSEVTSVSGLSRATNSPAVVSEPSSAELVRQGQRRLELQEREAEENTRVADLTKTLMQATFEFSHQESTQRLEMDQRRLELDRQRVQIEEQRLQVEANRLQLEQHRLQLEEHNQLLEVERLALASVATQMSLGVVPGRMPGIALGPQNRPPQASDHQSLTPAVPHFNAWLDQARAYYAHSMGYPRLAPTSTAAPDYPTPTGAQQRTPGDGAGPSNHARRLRGFTPPASQARIEDLGTVHVTPRAQAESGNLEDIDGMELEHEDDDEDGNGNGMGYGEQF